MESLGKIRFDFLLTHILCAFLKGYESINVNKGNLKGERKGRFFFFRAYGGYATVGHYGQCARSQFGTHNTGL